MFTHQYKSIKKDTIRSTKEHTPGSLVTKLVGVIPGMGSANDGRRYIVTSLLNGWAHIQNDPRLRQKSIPKHDYSYRSPCKEMKKRRNSLIPLHGAAYGSQGT